MRKPFTRSILAILLVLALGAAASAETVNKTFSLGPGFGDRVVFEFEVRETGTITVRATWIGTAADLALILNGPGQEGYYQRVDGHSPLVVTQEVTQAILRRGPKWKASIVNFGRRGAAAGTMVINYPSGHGGGHGPGPGPGWGEPGWRFAQFCRLNLVDVDRAERDRAILTVDYTLTRREDRRGWRERERVFLGAAALNNGREVPGFGFQPVRLNQRNGQAKVVLIYQRGTQQQITTDQVAVFLYEGGEQPFCKLIHDLDLDWRRR